MWSFILTIFTKLNLGSYLLKYCGTIVCVVVAIFIGNYVCDYNKYKDLYEEAKTINAGLAEKVVTLTKLKSARSDTLEACLKREQDLVASFVSTENLFNLAEGEISHAEDLPTLGDITEKKSTDTGGDTQEEDTLSNIEQSIQ